MRSVRGAGVILVQRPERDIHTAGGKLHFPENAFLDEIHGSVLSWYCVLCGSGGPPCIREHSDTWAGREFSENLWHWL